MKNNYTKLNNLQLGKLGEYYAKMLFTSYGYYVFTSEVDGHGVDFVAKSPKDGKYYEVQVKSVRNNSCVVLMKNKTTISDNNLICYLRFEDGQEPLAYVIPTTAWNNPNTLFADREKEYGSIRTKRN